MASFDCFKTFVINYAKKTIILCMVHVGMLKASETLLQICGIYNQQKANFEVNLEILRNLGFKI